MKKLLFTSLATAAGMVLAEGLHVENYEEMVFPVAEGQSETRAPATVGEQATLFKTGAGELRLPTAGLWQGGDVRVGVREGTLTLTDDAVADPTVPAAFAKAAFHVSARTGLVVSNGTDGADYVYEWSDVREAARTLGDTSPRTYPWAKAAWDPYSTKAAYAGVAPKLVTADDGCAHLHFGGYASGQHMRWKNPDGSNADITGITDLFFVANPSTAWGYVVSSADNPSDFQTGATSSLDVGGYWTLSGDFAMGPHDNAVMLRNGERIDPADTPVTAGRQLLDLNFQRGRHPHAGVFFSDRCDRLVDSSVLKGRCGGDGLCEVVVFTNALTAAERAEITRYLALSWKLVIQPSLNVTLAAGASVASEVADGKTASLPVGKLGGTLAKTGEGTLQVDYGVDATGEIRLEEGTLALKGAPRVSADNGTALQVADGDRLVPVVTKVADATGVLAKEGDGRLRLGTLPDGTERLVVCGGTLALTATSATASPLLAGSVTAVVVPNGDFEEKGEAPSSTGIKYFAQSTTAASSLSWYGKKNPNSTYASGVGYCYSGDAMIGSKKTTDEGWALAIKGDCSAWTVFDVTTAGPYELSFETGGRNAVANQVDVYLGLSDSTDPDPADLTLLGSVRTKQGTFVRSAFRTGTLATGRYVLYFRSPNLGTDRVAAIDDVRMDLVLRTEPDDGAVPVPCGDFESVTADSPNPELTTRTTVPVGWTIDQRDTFAAETTYASALIAVTDTRYNASDPRLYAAEDAEYGCRGLLFISTGALVSATFVPPKGTWTLRCRARQQRRNGNSFLKGGANLNKSPDLVAAVDGVSLGSLAEPSFLMESRSWPTTFAADGTTSRTLTLEQRSSGGFVLVDDLELVPAGGAATADGELLTNGSFEAVGTWTYDKNDDVGGNTSGKSQRFAAGTTPQYWGDRATGYDGSWAWRVTQIGSAVQSVTLPETGMYRLSFRVLSRIESVRGCNPIRAWLTAPGGGATTNVIAYTEVSATNFVEHVFCFKAAAGTYDFGLQGVNDVRETDNGDRSSLVDAVSLVRASEADVAPTLPEELSVEVAAGARLRLDFDGTCPVGKVRLGGRSVSGEISAARFPAYVEGPGCLSVPRTGMVLIFR